MAQEPDIDATLTFRSRRAAMAALEEVQHVLMVAETGNPVGEDRRVQAHRYHIGPAPLRIGRVQGNDIVLPTPEVSRQHCMLVVEDGRGAVVTDLGSTNGTFVDGQRLTQPVMLSDHALLAVGSHTLLYRRGTAEQIARAATLEQEMERAVRYVRAVLPDPIREGPIRADWAFLPSAKLGGDGFGYHRLRDGRFALWLLDVVGHGVGSALLAVSAMNMLRQTELPGADPGEPEQVLAALNGLFPMDRHGGLCFSLWYGVFDPASRSLRHGSAGHHAAYLVAPGTAPQPLLARNLLLGAVPDIAFRSAEAVVPADSRLYLFSDGAFEVTGMDGEQLGLPEFLPLIAAGPVAGLAEPDRILKAVRDQARPGPLDDDVSILVAQFA